MIKDALEYLSGLVTKAAEPKPIVTDDPRMARWLVGGQVVEVECAVPPRDHAVKNLNDVVALANRFATPEEMGVPVVWYDEAEVVLVLDDAGHRVETATIQLVKSAPFAFLEELATRKPWMNQKDFVRLLRISLANTGDQTTRLLAAVRDVRFENGATTTGRLARDQESLGRTITSAVKSTAGEIPEDVTIFVSVYTTPGANVEVGVRCSVEVEPADGTFRLLPLPDELTRVQKIVMDAIRAALIEGLPEGVPAYHGRP